MLANAADVELAQALCGLDLSIGLGHAHFQRAAFRKKWPARDTVRQWLVDIDQDRFLNRSSAMDPILADAP